MPGSAGPTPAKPVLGARQRTTGEEGGGDGDVITREAAQVLGQQVPLAQLGGGRCHRTGDGGEVGEP